LSIKENTVKKMLLRIYDKLGLSNRIELVLFALTHRDRYSSQGLPAKHPPSRAVLNSTPDDLAGPHIAYAGVGETN
jgi:hypothetical protein